MKPLFIVSFCILLFACGGNQSKTQSADSISASDTIHVKTAKQPKSILPVNPKLNAWAEFIAGKSGSGTYHAADSAVWQRYQTGTDERWKVLQERIGEKITKWVANVNLEQKNESNKLFYPFAGGDFYYANLFFPNQDTTIMIGLEPCGSIFNPDKLSNADLAEYLDNLSHTMFFPHRLGFFRTKSMEKDFENGPLNGTLHTVLFYMSRFNYKINYIELFNLDKDGKEINTIDAGDLKNDKKRIGYRVGYSDDKNSFVKEVIYFSYDASDGNMRANPGLAKWLDRRGEVVTFFKAASYLMHYSSFSMVRNFVTKKSNRILQDDSGIPYEILQQNNFDVALFGTFTQTIKLFKKEYQPNLKKAYEVKKPEKLPFMIGYSVPLGECNLQSATKKR